MPRLQRRQAAHRVSDLSQLSKAVRGWLESGWANSTGTCFWEISKMTRQQFDDLWATFGAEITELWIERYPGTRPFGWWLIDHGQERPAVEGAPYICRNGKGSHCFGFWHEESSLDFCGAQEPQEDYLQRYGLLSAAEIQAIADRPPVDDGEGDECQD